MPTFERNWSELVFFRAHLTVICIGLYQCVIVNNFRAAGRNGPVNTFTAGKAGTGNGEQGKEKRRLNGTGKGNGQTATRNNA